jgi:hypothetical protein
VDHKLIDIVSRAIVLARNDYLNSHNPIAVPLTETVIEKLSNGPEAQAVAKVAIETVWENECCENCKRHLIAPAFCTECSWTEEYGDYDDFSITR